MKRAYRGMVLVVTALGISIGCSALAQDWPQWRGPNRDGKATGFNAPKSWPKELKQEWQTKVGSGDASPACVGDRLYVFSNEGGNEIIRCLDAKTGKELWQNKYEVPAVSGPDSGHGGPRSSPAVADGKVVTLGVNGTVSCVDAQSGKLLWRKNDFPDAWPKFHTATSPLVTGGMCITQLGKESEGAMVAYDLNTGDQKWKWADEGPGYASPVLMTLNGTPVVVTLTSKSVVGIQPSDGKLLWKFAFAPQGMNYNAATPIVDGDKVIVSGQGRGTKALKVAKEGDAYAAKELWSNTDIAVQFNTPVSLKGMLYGVSGKDVLFCINAEDGKTVWTAPASGKRGFGSVVDAGGVLMSLTPNSQLSVFAPSDKEFQQVANYKVSDGETYASPVPAGGGIYVKDKDSLTLWKLES